MAFFFRMVLLVIWSLLNLAEVESSLDLVLMESLKKAMQCPAVEPARKQPVIALSPARYLQLISLVRHDTKEIACQGESRIPFNLGNPQTWSFCTVGICSDDKCFCFEGFTGEKCQRFGGSCWLFYCHLEGCEATPTKFSCNCDPSLYGQPVSTGEYWYDEGLRHEYRPPPPGFRATEILESRILYQGPEGHYELRGANSNKYRKKQSNKKSGSSRGFPNSKQRMKGKSRYRPGQPPDISQERHSSRQQGSYQKFQQKKIGDPSLNTVAENKALEEMGRKVQVSHNQLNMRPDKVNAIPKQMSDASNEFNDQAISISSLDVEEFEEGVGNDVYLETEAQQEAEPTEASNADFLDHKFLLLVTIGFKLLFA